MQIVESRSRNDEDGVDRGHVFDCNRLLCVGVRQCSVPVGVPWHLGRLGVCEDSLPVANCDLSVSPMAMG